MILGIGIDLVDSRRIQKLMDQHETRFLDKYFTSFEKTYIQSIEYAENRILSIAKRFAAKEACAKALGTGFRDGIAMKNMEIKNDNLGKPMLTLSGKALSFAQDELAKGENFHVHLSLTDEPPYAQAQVIIEKL